MTDETIVDRLDRYGDVLTESLSASSVTPEIIPPERSGGASWAKPAIRVAVAAGIIVVGLIGVRSVLDGPDDTVSAVSTPEPAPAPGLSPQDGAGSAAESCRRSISEPEVVGILLDHGLTVESLERVNAVTLTTPTRPDVPLVILRTETVLVTCTLDTLAAADLLIAIDEIGLEPDSDSIAVWGLGDQSPPTGARGGSPSLYLFGRAGLDVKTVFVDAGSKLTQGVVQDGWFLVDASVPEVPTAERWGLIGLEWWVRNGANQNRKLAELRPDLNSLVPVHIEDVGLNITEAAMQAATSTWLNMVGLAETDNVVWSERLQRACNNGIWIEEVGLSLAAEFIEADLDKSVRANNLDEPTTQEGATALWLMAVQVCRDAFPPEALDAGPPPP